MHKYKNYNHDENSAGSFLKNSSTQRIYNKAYENKQYKLVDVVMESEGGYQYVIPFTVVDVKWLHQKPRDMHYAMFTDNTYGHVYENIDANGNHIYSYMNPIEPYIQVKYNGIDFNDEISALPITGDMNEKITEYVFGRADTKDKIVSMRIYDKKFDESDPTWWKRIRDSMENRDIIQYKTTYKSSQYPHKGIIVKYK